MAPPAKFSSKKISNDKESKLRDLKIILVCSRYTGKGQIGKSWGRTDAGIPTLQPVILYEKKVSISLFKNKNDEKSNSNIRVVAWVLSYDPESAQLRKCFYKYPPPNGIIFTFDRTGRIKNSLQDLKLFYKELQDTLIEMPPSILIGMKLRNEDIISESIIQSARKWGNEMGIKEYFDVDYENINRFNQTIEKAFYILLNEIIGSEMES
ncbi:MAG: hypothetical protein ACTSRZ_16175 [Promethearchaeota archaeon]